MQPFINRFTKFLLTCSPIVKFHKPEVLATQVIEETFNKISTNNLDFAVRIENMPFSVLSKFVPLIISLKKQAPYYRISPAIRRVFGPLE